MGFVSTVNRVAVIAITSIVIAAFSAQSRAADGTEYATLVAQVKSGKDVDFGKLRDAYAESPDYDPYSTKTMDLLQQMREAGNRDDCQTVVARAKSILEIQFVSIDAHLYAASCYDKLGQSAEAARERTIGRGLIQSIMKSGDGKSAKTAFNVISVAEEYAVLLTLNIQHSQQALMDIDGSSYDVFTVKTQGGDKSAPSVYFKIDRVFGKLKKDMK